jgi:hypothetical protein
MAEHKIGLIAQHGRTPRDEEAREQVTEVLEDAEVGPIDDETGVFEIELEADSYDDAVLRVIDAMAAAGVDDHLMLAEHPPPSV